MFPARLLLLAALLSPAAAQQGRGRRRKVLRRRPATITPSPAPAAPRALPTLPPPPPALAPAPAPVPVTDLECPELEGLQIYPHPDSCNQFYKCANSSLTLETCGNGLLFNEATALTGAAHNFCSYNWETDCGGRSNDSTALSSPGCPFRFGIFPSGPGCYASYTKCANGIPTEVYCQLGLAYDDRIHTCNWPDLLMESVGCDPSAALGDFRCPATAELSSLAQRFFPFPRFPVAKDPRLYIICLDGVPRLNSCGEGSLFSEESLGCEEEL